MNLPLALLQDWMGLSVGALLLRTLVPLGLTFVAIIRVGLGPTSAGLVCLAATLVIWLCLTFSVNTRPNN